MGERRNLSEPVLRCGSSITVWYLVGSWDGPPPEETGRNFTSAEVQLKYTPVGLVGNMGIRDKVKKP